MISIIEKKRDGKVLTKEEIVFFINGYVDGSIPDYQASALLMAIFLKGMNDEEISTLTETMLNSGDKNDLSGIQGIKVDKHSTGGVGDKTSLVVGPVVAACGAKVAKMSGRGLGHTGGTLDKLEAIPGLSIAIESEDFFKQVNEIGVAIIGQTGQLVPADKKIYALRDVTGTVDSIPLIASSIMSKKLASGSDTILLDVKVGNGAFMKDIESATKLAETMIAIGKSFGKDTRAEITDMNQPLGLAVGNALEVIEAVDTLKGHGPADFTELCMDSCVTMLLQAKICKTEEEAFKLCQEKIQNGEALEKFIQMVEYQHGDSSYIKDTNKFPKAKHIVPIYAPKSGYIVGINALEIGEYAMRLGAGREVLDSVLDYASGIVLNKKIGDKVTKGDILCYVHTEKDDYENIIKGIDLVFETSDTKNEQHKIIYAVLS